MKYFEILNTITADYLRDVRMKALRKRTWFKAIDRVERGIMDLTIRLVENLKSHVLACEIVKILTKLKKAATSAFTRHIEFYGYRKLQEAISLAKSFGNDLAEGWLNELGYASWFALNSYNNPVGWRDIN